MYKRYVIRDLVSGLYWNGFDNDFLWGKSVASAYMFSTNENATNAVLKFEDMYEGIVVTIIEVYL